MGILHLDHSLAQPHQVGPDPEGPAAHLWRQDPSCIPQGQCPTPHSGDGPGATGHEWKLSLATGILIGGRTAWAQACPSGCLTSTERMGLARKSVVKTHADVECSGSYFKRHLCGSSEFGHSQDTACIHTMKGSLGGRVKLGKNDRGLCLSHGSWTRGTHDLPKLSRNFRRRTISKQEDLYRQTLFYCTSWILRFTYLFFNKVCGNPVCQMRVSIF